MFAKDRFIEDCKRAVAEGQAAVREVVTEALSDPAAVMAELGEPERAGIVPIHRSSELTVINFAWAPCMSLMPHDHQMYAVIGIYTGREDNVFWRRSGSAMSQPSAGTSSTLSSTPSAR
jgi:predicted metal-dependent enzyme (double-stranded beta helix superfamily)